MKHIILGITLFCSFFVLQAQLKLNEASSCNKFSLFDEEGDAKSWIELYNNSGTAINLSNFYISDNKNNLQKFRLPDRNIGPFDYQLIYASSKNKGAYVNPVSTHHWEMAITQGDFWRYEVADGSNDPLWRNRTFNDASWLLGRSGIGYGDGDDSTIVPTCFAVYMRYNFTITDTSKIMDAILHMDYDDGFVAYLNGIEIARANLLLYPPNWDELAADHEAGLYAGAAAPEMFMLNRNLIKSLIINGTNNLAIEVHNADTASTDLTAIPFLSFLVKNGSSFYSSPPAWFSTVYNGNIHANFQISNKAETIYLSNLSSVINDSLVLTPMNPDESIGRYLDGTATIRSFNFTTPGYTNNVATPYTSREAKPTINLYSGVFTTAQSVSITNNSTSGGQVRYTTNGQDPTASSTLYTAPFLLSTTAVVKARCFGSASALPSACDAKTYVFNEDYTVPIYSITADSADLYGWPGIIDNPWSDYKVPCHIDIFDVDNTVVTSQNSSIRIDGGAGGSRGNPQRSFRLDFDNNNFGDGVVNYALLPEKPEVDKFSSVYLRNGSNFWNSIFFKEAFMERVSRRDTFAIYNAYRPVVVLLNGEFFGVYELREKYTDSYLKYNYGADKDSVDILSVSYFNGPGIINTLDGSAESWFEAHRYIMGLDTASSSFLPDVNTVLDAKNFANYMAIENYWANYDWIWNNMKMVRMSSIDKKWRFALQDMEWGFTGWGNYWDNMFDYMDYSEAYTYVNIYGHLLNNRKYKNFFINRYADLLNTDMLPDTMRGVFRAMWNEALPEWNRQILRWQDSDTANLTMHMNEFIDLRSRFFEYINLRPEIVRDQIINRFALEDTVQITLRVNPPNTGTVRISTVTAPYYPWTGIYFNGNSVDLEARPKTGYVFANWDTSTFITDTSLSTFQSNVNRSTVFTANFEEAPVIIDTNTAIQTPIEEAADIALYPNPSTSISYVSMPFEGEKTIYIYSVTGVLLDKQSSQMDLAMLDTKSLAKGLYLVKVSVKDKIYTKKLLVE